MSSGPAMRVRCDDRTGPVWRLRLVAPPGAEVVISAEGLTELEELLEQAARSESCRVLVLEGEGGTFCRGMDLAALVRDPSVQADVGIEQFARCLARLQRCRQLVVTLVDGVVVGGGLALAAAADRLVATRASSFGLPEVVIGLVPALVMAVLVARMPPQKARRLALGATSLPADEAKAVGLCDEVVADSAELERALRQIVRQALRLEPAAVAETKRLSHELVGLGPEQALAAAADAIRGLLRQPAKIDVIAAYLAGDPLPWFTRWRGPNDPGANG